MWEKVKLGELSEIRTGKYDANHAVEDGEYPFYTCAIGQFKSNTYSFDGQLIILPGNGANVGEVMVYDGKIEAYQRTYVVHRIKSDLNFKFLYYFLKASWKKHVLKKQVGSATNYFKYNDLASLEIPLPPLHIQEKIAEILDKADELRRKDKNLQSKYDKLAQSIFIDMFGDPVSNEKDWEVKKLVEVCTKITDGTHQSPVFTDSGIPFILVSNIVNSKINYVTKKFISESTFDILNKRTPIQIGCILLTTVGSYGNPAIIESDRKFAFQRHIAYLQPRHEYINYVFLHGLLKSNTYKQLIDKTVKGVAQKTLNLVEIKKFNIILPPLELQKEFAKKIDLINQLKAQTNTKRSEELFHSLITKAFKEELLGNF